MTITFHLPSALREHADGRASVRIAGSGDSVHQAFEALFAEHPALRDRLLTEQGNVRPHVAIFVGPESIRYSGGFETRVRDGDEVTILPAVSGG
ncbi:MAG: MoaD family protein [Holophagales bacterium]|nr:MoaD family protein [Holophagales bacterium]